MPPGTRWPHAWVLVVFIAALPLPILASSDQDSLIIPSKSIGPFLLGMTPAEIDTVKGTAPCDVAASFALGKAAWLETNCGGAYRTAEYITVGLDPSRMLSVFGNPDKVVKSDFANVRGEWLHYTQAGIAFRIVYGNPGNAIIQAIAVFRGNALQQIPLRPVPPPPATPPPGVAE